MHGPTTARMLLEAIPQFPRLRLFILRLPDKTSAGFVHSLQQGSIDRKNLRFHVHQDDGRSVDNRILCSPRQSRNGRNEFVETESLHCAKRLERLDRVQSALECARATLSDLRR